MDSVVVYLLRVSAHAGMPLPLGRRPRGVVELHVAAKCVSLRIRSGDDGKRRIRLALRSTAIILSVGSHPGILLCRLPRKIPQCRGRRERSGLDSQGLGLMKTIKTHLVQGHSVLDEESNATVEVANIALENKVLL